MSDIFKYLGIAFVVILAVALFCLFLAFLHDFITASLCLFSALIMITACAILGREIRREDDDAEIH